MTHNVNREAVKYGVVIPVSEEFWETRANYPGVMDQLHRQAQREMDKAGLVVTDLALDVHRPNKIDGHYLPLWEDPETGAQAPPLVLLRYTAYLVPKEEI